MKNYRIKNYRGNLIESLTRFSRSHRDVRIVEAVEDGDTLKIKTDVVPADSEASKTLREDDSYDRDVEAVNNELRNALDPTKMDNLEKIVVDGIEKKCPELKDKSIVCISAKNFVGAKVKKLGISETAVSKLKEQYKTAGFFLLCPTDSNDLDDANGYAKTIKSNFSNKFGYKDITVIKAKTKIDGKKYYIIVVPIEMYIAFGLQK